MGDYTLSSLSQKASIAIYIIPQILESKEGVLYNTSMILKNLVIHTCCADCLLNALLDLKSRGLIDKETEITSLFYNPNIHPRTEYLERLNAVKKIFPELKEKWNIKLVIPNYSPKEYLSKVLDNKKNRCAICWNLRLENLFNYAKEKKIKNVTTTLLTSHYQERDTIVKIAKDLNKKYNINFIEIDNISNRKHSGFYKQNYCGCCFSLTEKMISFRKN
jgi:predicted adenine nucleotide alpha hydrolase (AANH) superfamily ATPase